MIKTGLVVKIEDEYAIVMTKDNTYQRIIIKDDMNIGSKIMFTEADVMQNYRKKRDYSMKKKLLLSIPALAIVFMLIVFNTGDVVNIDNPELISTTIITVDINPSFKIYADADNNVLNVESMNEDAKTIKSDDLVGMSVINAVELIVGRSELAGFIDTEDLEEDFVLITTIDADETDSVNNTQMLMTQLQTKAQTSENLAKVNVAMTQANMEQLKTAEQKNISVGLSATNNENSTTVKEFFANQENIELFEQNGYLIQNSFNHQLQIMETMIDESDFSGELQNSFALEFQYSKNAYLEASNQYQQALNNYNNASDTEKQNLLEETEQLKLQLEITQQNVLQVKEIFKNAVNNNESEAKIMEQLENQTTQRQEQQTNKQDDTGSDNQQTNKQDDMSNEQQNNETQDQQANKAETQSSQQKKN